MTYTFKFIAGCTLTHLFRYHTNLHAMQNVDVKPEKKNIVTYFGQK